MKRTLAVALVVSVLSVPAASFAQSLTRAQVRAELVELQQAGYRGDTETSYPAAIQAAERRLATTPGRPGEQRTTATSYGPDAAGSAGNGKRDSEFTGLKPIYSGQ